MSKLQIVIVLVLVAALLVASVGAVFAGRGWGAMRACRRGKVENKKHCATSLVVPIGEQYDAVLS